MTIRVFIGCGVDGHDAEACLALDYSIRSRTAEPVEIVLMRLDRDRRSLWYSSPETGEGWQTGNWVTEFSGLRWAIPAACGYRGRAIYTDCDVLFLADIAELFNMPLAPGKAVAAKSDRRFCVMLMDCGACQRLIPPLAELQRGAGNSIKGRPDVVQVFTPDQAWNCLDGEDLPVERIKALHFTSIDSQPQGPLAAARLAAEGRRHWFDGAMKPHWRPELTALWRHEYEAALASQYRLADYDQQPRFGDVPKRSLSQYRGLNDR